MVLTLIDKLFHFENNYYGSVCVSWCAYCMSKAQNIKFPENIYDFFFLLFNFFPAKIVFRFYSIVEQLSGLTSDPCSCLWAFRTNSWPSVSNVLITLADDGWRSSARASGPVAARVGARAFHAGPKLRSRGPVNAEPRGPALLGKRFCIASGDAHAANRAHGAWLLGPHGVSEVLGQPEARRSVLGPGTSLLGSLCGLHPLPKPWAREAAHPADKKASHGRALSLRGQ